MTGLMPAGLPAIDGRQAVIGRQSAGAKVERDRFPCFTRDFRQEAEMFPWFETSGDLRWPI